MATTGAAETVTIPCSNAGTFDAVIDWGDGSTSEITAYNDADLAHEYADADDYTIRISGTFPNIYFNNGGDKLKLKEVVNLGNVGWVDFYRSFSGCSNMTSFTVGNTDISAATRLQDMFNGCSGLTLLSLTGFNTSLITTMVGMFSGCAALVEIDVSGFDMTSVTTVNGMFYSCFVADDIPMDAWIIESITDMTSMMINCALLTSRYDAILIAWDAQNPVDSLSPNFGASKYTGGGAAAAARANLISTDLWTITDAGIA